MSPDEAAAVALGRAPVGADELELGQHLVGAIEVARTRWPDVEVDVTAFIQRLAELAGDGADPLGGLAVEDLWLTTAVLQGDAKALERFERDFLADALRSLRKKQVGLDTIEEVGQILRQRLLVAGPGGQDPRLQTFAGRGPLRSWLVVAAVRIAVRENERSARLSVEPLEEAESALREFVDFAPALDLDRVLINQEAREALREALTHAATHLAPRDRTLLRLHVTDELSIDQIAALYAIHRATAARQVERARRRFALATRRRLAQRLRLPKWELDSLLRKIRSSFDASLSRLLGDDEDG